MRFSSCFLSVALLFSSLAIADDAARETGQKCGTAVRNMRADNPAELRETFLECLGAYVRIATVNPPGNETIAVDFLEALFKEIGIPTWRFGARDRQNLVATLTPTNARLGITRGEPFAWGKPTETADTHVRVDRSIVLLNHLDVVDVFPEQWAKPEYVFSGRVAPFPGQENGEGYLWGRGSLDMKGIGMLQLFSMAMLKSQKTEMSRTIHFLAVSDEEQGASGAKLAASEVRRGGALEALFKAELLFGEGGFGVKDAMGKNTVLNTIGAEEKGGAWMRLTHPSADTLFADLVKLQLLPRSKDSVPRAFRGLGCSVVYGDTPKAKVNVVPSKVEMRITCKKLPSEADVRTAFLKGAEKTTVTAVRATGNEMNITVETSSSAHGSVGLSVSALEIAALGLQRIGALKVRSSSKPAFFNYYLTDASRAMLNTIGEHHNFGYVPHIRNLEWLVRHLPIYQQKALGFLGNKLATERLFRTSCTWTGFRLAPGAGSEALLDCRLIPPAGMGLPASKKEGSQFAALVKKYVGDAQLNLQIIEEWNSSASPLLHHAVGVIGEEFSRENPRVVSSTFLFPGGTDNHIFREMGVPSYGFFPVELTMELVATQHGSNERYPVNQIIPSIQVYSRVMSRLVK